MYFRNCCIFFEGPLQSVATGPFAVSLGHAVISDCRKLKKWESVSKVHTQLRESRSSGLKISKWDVQRESRPISLTYFSPWENEVGWECAGPSSRLNTEWTQCIICGVGFGGVYVYVHFWIISLQCKWFHSEEGVVESAYYQSKTEAVNSEKLESGCDYFITFIQ
jgi:hypothetical protein